MCPYLLLLCLILQVPYALAGSRVTNSNFSPLLVPSCAEACLQDFISDSFPSSVCSSSDIRCLCTGRSASGFTLGEGATQCVASACPEARPADYETAYDICSGVPNAAVETHKTLSASMASPSTILIDDGPETTEPSKTASSPSLDPSTTPTGILTDSDPDPLQTNFSILFSGTFTPSTPSAISTAAPQNSATATAAASASGAAQPVLTTPQIAGVSVAGGAIAFAALGLLLFLFCSKRRQARRDSGSSFGNDKIENGPRTPPRGSPPTASGSAALGIHTPSRALKAGDRLAVPAVGPERGMGRALPRSGPRHMASPNRNDMSSESSPISVASYRTTARLLPDVPTMSTVSPSRSSSLHPGQPPKYAGGIGLKLTSPTPPQSVFDPSGLRAAPSISQRYNPSSYGHSRQPSDPRLPPGKDPREMMYAMEPRRASYKDLPPLVTPAYPNTRNAWSPSGSSQPPLPVPAFLPANPRPPQRPANPHAQNRSPHALGPPVEFAQQQDRPPTNFSRHPSQHRRQMPQPQSPNPAEAMQHDRYPPRPARRPVDRPSTHYTSTSDTDIEDEPDSDDEARDHVPHLLSPVVESPFRRRPTPPRTPLSQLRYPPIPPSRSSPRAELAGFGPTTPELAAGDLRSPPLAGPFELPERSTSRRGPLPPHLVLGGSRVQPPEANQHLKGTAKYQVLCTPGNGAAGERSPRKGLTGWKTPPAAQRGYR